MKYCSLVVQLEFVIQISSCLKEDTLFRLIIQSFQGMSGPLRSWKLEVKFQNSKPVIALLESALSGKNILGSVSVAQWLNSLLRKPIGCTNFQRTFLGRKVHW